MPHDTLEGEALYNGLRTRKYLGYEDVCERNPSWS